MPQARVGQARGTGLRPRSLRIDRSRGPVGLNWEYQPHLATYATMCLTEVEREFCPASPDSRWDPLTRFLTLIVPGCRSRGGVTLSEQPQDVNEPAASRIPGQLVTCATYTGHCGHPSPHPDGDVIPSGTHYTSQGKWWSTSALRPDWAVAMVTGVTDPDAPVGRRHSLVLVPTGTPGMTVLRNTPTMTDY